MACRKVVGLRLNSPVESISSKEVFLRDKRQRLYLYVSWRVALRESLPRSSAAPRHESIVCKVAKIENVRKIRWALWRRRAAHTYGIATAKKRLCVAGSRLRRAAADERWRTSGRATRGARKMANCGVAKRPQADVRKRNWVTAGTVEWLAESTQRCCKLFLLRLVRTTRTHHCTVHLRRVELEKSRKLRKSRPCSRSGSFFFPSRNCPSFFVIWNFTFTFPFLFFIFLFLFPFTFMFIIIITNETKDFLLFHKNYLQAIQAAVPNN